MGQRLAIIILKNGMNAGVYYSHYDAYSLDVLNITKDILDNYNKSLSGVKNDELLVPFMLCCSNADGKDPKVSLSEKFFRQLNESYPIIIDDIYLPDTNANEYAATVKEERDNAISNADHTIFIDMDSRKIDFGVYYRYSVEDYVHDYLSEEEAKAFNETDYPIMPFDLENLAFCDLEDTINYISKNEDIYREEFADRLQIMISYQERSIKHG